MGEVTALLTALLWAVASTMIGSQTARVPTAMISLIQLVCASLMLWVVAAALFLAGDIEGTTLPRGIVLAASALIGPGLGDMLYFAGIRMIGVARAFPISMAGSPLFTLALAAVLLGEAITIPIVLGAALIITGICLIATRQGETQSSHGRVSGAGVAIVLAAALLWALSSITLGAAADGVAPLLVSAIRIPAAALFAALVARGSGLALAPEAYGRRSFVTLGAAGVLGMGAGSLLYVVAIQRAGAARTAILSSTAPLFALPLAALLLRERITHRVAAGTVLSIAGIWLVAL